MRRSRRPRTGMGLSRRQASDRSPLFCPSARPFGPSATAPEARNRPFRSSFYFRLMVDFFERPSSRSEVSARKARRSHAPEARNKTHSQRRLTPPERLGASRRRGFRFAKTLEKKLRDGISELSTILRRRSNVDNSAASNHNFLPCALFPLSPAAP